MRYISTYLSVFFIVAFIQGCGSNDTASNSGGFADLLPKTIIGTASQGAPIAGSVTLKDSKGVIKTASIDPSTGVYSIVVDGMEAPFILRAGNCYSVASSSTTTNINPLTDLCVKAAAGSASVDTIFTAPSQQLSTLATKLPGIVADLKTALNGLYPSSVPATKRDFMNGTLTIDQGVDLLFAKISVSTVSAGFDISLSGLNLITVASSNGTVTVTPSLTNIASASSTLFPTAVDTTTGGGTAKSTAAKTSSLSAGDPDCPTGGILVQTGIDKNGNGILDASEVTNSQKVCNGATGETGATGPAGASGTGVDTANPSTNIIDTWNFSQYGSTMPNTGKITFTSDGKYTSSDEYSNYSGVWSVIKDNYIVFTPYFNYGGSTTFLVTKNEPNRVDLFGSLILILEK